MVRAERARDPQDGPAGDVLEILLLHPPQLAKRLPRTVNQPPNERLFGVFQLPDAGDERREPARPGFHLEQFDDERRAVAVEGIAQLMVKVVSGKNNQESQNDR